MNFSYEVRLGMNIADQIVKMICESTLGHGGKIQYGYLLSVSESNRKFEGEDTITTTLKYHFELGMTVTLHMIGEDGHYGMNWKMISGKARFFHEDLKWESEQRKTQIQFSERILWDKEFAQMFFKNQAKKLGFLEIKNKQRKNFVAGLLADRKLMFAALEAAELNGFAVIKYEGGSAYGSVSTIGEALQSLPYYETAKFATSRSVSFYKMTLKEIKGNLEAADTAIRKTDAPYWGTVRQFGELINAGTDNDGVSVGNNGIMLRKQHRDRFPYLYARVHYGHDGRSYGRGIGATE